MHSATSSPAAERRLPPRPVAGPVRRRGRQPPRPPGPHVTPRIVPAAAGEPAGHRGRPDPHPDHPQPLRRRQPVRHVPPGLRRRHDHRQRGRPPRRPGRPQAAHRGRSGRRPVSLRRDTAAAPPPTSSSRSRSIVYERSLGRLRANAFSYSGNPQGCDHAIRHLHGTLDDLQAKIVGSPMPAGGRRRHVRPDRPTGRGPAVIAAAAAAMPEPTGESGRRPPTAPNYSALRSTGLRESDGPAYSRFAPSLIRRCSARIRIILDSWRGPVRGRAGAGPLR